MKKLLIPIIAALMTSLSVAEVRNIEVPCSSPNAVFQYLASLGENPVVRMSGELPNTEFVLLVNKIKPSWSMVSIIRQGNAEPVACLIGSGGQYEVARPEKPTM